jgi:V8-like Glu-specific endopeptidase
MKRNHAVHAALIGLAFCAAFAGRTSAVGQEILIAPLESRQVAIEVDSGLVENTGSEPAVVFSATVTAPDAFWLRLNFHKVLLAGEAAAGNGSYLQITSAADGAVQFMQAEHIVQWRNTSAYFNGDSVQIDLIACPNTGPNHLVMTEVTAGVPGHGSRSICGPTDDRVLSDDPRAGRALPVGCSAWIIDDCNHCLLTAGHCFGGGDVDVVEFNVPLSDAEGGLNHPPPEDQYAVDQSSVQYLHGGVGNDWGYFGCFPNSSTDLTPFEAQGGCYAVVEPYPVSGDIRITGYGTVSPPVPLEWNQVQKTHTGPYWAFHDTTLEYQTDTTGGNSGSPVIYEDTGEAIGIHTHGGCSTYDGNSGTGANHVGLQGALAEPRGVCIPVGLEFDYPDGLPELVSPAGGTTVRVEVSSGGDYTPQPGTGQLHYDIGAGFVTVEMEQVSENVYDAVFPAVDCLTLVSYAFSAEATNGQRFYDPPGIDGPPAHPYTVTAGYGTIVVLDEPLSTDPGWTTEAQWAWGQPTGGGGQYGGPDPTSGYTGDNVYGYNLYGDYPNNMPQYHLTSTAINCTGLGGVRLSFWRWLGVEQPACDRAYVRVSDNGTNWTTVWQNTAEVTDYSWVYQEFDISAVADDRPTVYLRWTMGPSDGGWRYCGWNIDDVCLFAIDCEPPCPGDLDGDGDTDQADLGILLASYQTDAGGDLDGDGDTDQGDLGILLADWGCGT